MLGGLALTGYAVLFAPAFGGIDPARALDASATGYRAYRKTIKACRALRLVPRHHRCWWHLAKQQDDSFVSQISADIEVANLTDRPVRIVKARLIRPRTKGDLLDVTVMLPEAGSPYHSDKHAVPPHDTATASLHIMVRGALAPQGKPIHVTFGITDQFGDEYQLKGIVIRTHDRVLPKPPWTARLVSALRKLSGLRPPTEPESNDARYPPPEWQHGGTFEQVDLILNEEKRAYSARGRTMGELGSLNVTLQSEPNFGWATIGSVPLLLWDKNQAKRIDSPNAARLINRHGALQNADKDSLEQYLLSHLHKGSRYADVAYFIFLALHRMGRTVDALRAARKRLAGDKIYADSNLLGTLSALVSHEHFEIDPGL